MDELVQAQAQDHQGLGLERSKRFVHKLRQEVIEAALTSEHTEDQLREQSPVRPAQLAFLQLAVDQPVGVAPLPGNVEQNPAGSLTGVGGG